LSPSHVSLFGCVRGITKIMTNWLVVACLLLWPQKSAGKMVLFSVNKKGGTIFPSLSSIFLAVYGVSVFGSSWKILEITAGMLFF